MKIIRTERQASNYNRPLYGITGAFTLSQGISLPYFVTLMDVDRAIDELRIAEQVPASLENQWSLQELFQREIDEDRVKDEIVKGYLLDPRKLKFFNAITIVLMPKAREGKILDSFDDSSNDIPPIPWDGMDPDDAQFAESPFTVANFGGVQYVNADGTGRLRWDQDRVLAVAVDGQHRLWALRQFKESPSRGGTLQPIEKATKLPVIFVLLDKAAGFHNEQDQAEYTIRGIARELFTDLNKNAKTVDRARELILDDKSVTALCVRTLLTERTAEDSNERLPLSLVRWQDDSNRFDSSYYLNSIVHLELVVSEMLNLKFPRDPMDAKQVKDFIQSVNHALGSGGEVSYQTCTLTKYYETDCCDENGEPMTPLARIPHQYLPSAVSGFEHKFRTWMLRLLLEFKPYRELIEYSREHNLITGQFGNYHAQTSKHRNAIKEQRNTVDSEWFRRDIQEHQDRIAAMKENKWAFKAIFQKAMMRLGRVIEFDYGGRDKNLGNIDTLLAFFNRLFDAGRLEVFADLPGHPYRLWSFIALNPGNEKIKVARAVENRIFSLLSLWYFGSRKVELEVAQGEKILSPTALLGHFERSKSKSVWPSCNDAVTSLLDVFKTPVLYGEKVDQLSDKAKAEKKKSEIARARFIAVLAAGLPTVEGPVTDEAPEGDETGVPELDTNVDAEGDDTTGSVGGIATLNDFAAVQAPALDEGPLPEPE